MFEFSKKSILKQIIDFCELPFSYKALDNICVRSETIQFVFNDFTKNRQIITISTNEIYISLSCGDYCNEILVNYNQDEIEILF